MRIDGKGCGRLLAAAWLLAGVRTAGGEVVVDGVAAFVNDHAITISEVLAYAVPLMRQLELRHAGEELRQRREEAFEEALQALIDEALILEKYEAGEGRIPEWTLDDHVSRIVQENFDGNRAALEAALAKDRITYAEWRDRIRRQFIAMVMRNEFVESKVIVSPQRVRRHYEQHQDQYRLPLEIRLRMIVIHRGATETEEQAARERLGRVRLALERGEDFAELARSNSDGVHAGSGGEWGWIRPDMLNPVLAAAAADLQPGQTGEPVEMDDAFYLLAVEERRESTVQPFAEVEQSIQNLLRDRDAEPLYRAWMEKLRQAAFIRTFNVSLSE